MTEEILLIGTSLEMLEEKIKTLEKNLAESQAQISALTREKTELEDKLERYEKRIKNLADKIESETEI